MKTKMSMAKETVAGSDFTGWEDSGNSDASLDEIVDELLLQLTLEEKLSYVSGFDDLAVKSIPRLNIPYVWASGFPLSSRPGLIFTGFLLAVVILNILAKILFFLEKWRLRIFKVCKAGVL